MKYGTIWGRLRGDLHSNILGIIGHSKGSEQWESEGEHMFREVTQNTDLFPEQPGQCSSRHLNEHLCYMKKGLQKVERPGSK